MTWLGAPPTPHGCMKEGRNKDGHFFLIVKTQAQMTENRIRNLVPSTSFNKSYLATFAYPLFLFFADVGVWSSPCMGPEALLNYWHFLPFHTDLHSKSFSGLIKIQFMFPLTRFSQKWVFRVNRSGPKEGTRSPRIYYGFCFPGNKGSLWRRRPRGTFCRNSGCYPAPAR